MRPILSLLFIATLFAFGCGEDIEEDKVVDEEMVTEEEMVVEPPTSLEKAQEDMEGVRDRRFEVYEEAEKSGDFSVLFTAADEIFQEELDFEKEFWQDLVNIWENIQMAKFQAGELDEDVANRYIDFFNTHTEKFLDRTLAKDYFDFVAAYDNIIIEYLRLSYEFPDSSKDELIEQFKESVQETDIEILYPEGF